MLQTYSLDLFSLADVRNRRSSCCNQHTVWFVWPDQLFFFFFFSNRKRWTQMFSDWMCIPWFSTNLICYLSDPKGIFNLQHLLLFFFFPSWWSNALSFYFKMWRIASVLLGNMNSSRVQSDSGRLWLRQRSPSQYLFISFNQDTSGCFPGDRRPMSGGAMSHLHIPQVWYFVNVSASEVHHLFFAATSLV